MVALPAVLVSWKMQGAAVGDGGVAGRAAVAEIQEWLLVMVALPAVLVS